MSAAAAEAVVVFALVGASSLLVPVPSPKETRRGGGARLRTRAACVRVRTCVACGRWQAVDISQPLIARADGAKKGRENGCGRIKLTDNARFGIGVEKKVVQNNEVVLKSLPRK